MEAIGVTASLSPPPPSFSRLPPDGHEFPPNYQEPGLEVQLTLLDNSGNIDKMHPPPLPTSAPPLPKKMMRLPSENEADTIATATKKFSPPSNEDVMRLSARCPSWQKDEKSGRSVKDKIAMFSNATDESPILPCVAPPSIAVRRLNRFKSSEDVFSHDTTDFSSGNLPSGKLLSRSVMSVDKVVPNLYQAESVQSSRTPMKKGCSNYNSLGDVAQNLPVIMRPIKAVKPSSIELGTRTQSSMDLTSSSSAYSSCSPESSLSPTVSPSYMIGYSSTLPKKPAERKASLQTATSTKPHPTISRAVSFSSGSNLHSRSQSLIDVAISPSKFFSVATKQNSEEARRASLNALIEQRRRSMSKLRGLVIPEKVSEVPAQIQPIVDLPEIKSRESILPSKRSLPFTDDVKDSHATLGAFGTNSPCSTNHVNNNYFSPSSNLMASPPWKTPSPVSDLPKYSPAFKRKGLAVYGVSSAASSVSSSLSSSREELRPFFDNAPNCQTKPPSSVLPPSKPPRSINTLNRINNHGMLSVIPPLHQTEPPKSLETIASPTKSDLTFEFISSTESSPDMRLMSAGQEEKNDAAKILYKNEPHVLPYIKMTCSKHRHSSDVRRSGEEESDNDSAVSSSRSSISHEFSPPMSPMPDNQHRLSADDDHTLTRQHMMLSPTNSACSSDRRTLRRTLSSETTASAASSTASTLTSGSQASCSSNGSTSSIDRRVLKAQSVEAINRKNVLSSARFSSGQDLKVGSPLIQRKFEDGLEADEVIEEGIQLALAFNSLDNEVNGNFISRLTDTLKKDDVVKKPVEPDENESVQYQVPHNPGYRMTNMKVAYLELEVVDGHSSQGESESNFSDNASSLDQLSETPPMSIHSTDISLTHSEDMVDDDQQSSNINVWSNEDEERNNAALKLQSSKTKANHLDSDETEDIVPSKPFIRRLSRYNHIPLHENEEHKCVPVRVDEPSIVRCDLSKLEESPKQTQRKSVRVANFENDEKVAVQNGLVLTHEKQGTVTSSKTFYSVEPPVLFSKIPTSASRAGNTRRSVSVSDKRKAFEKPDVFLPSGGRPLMGKGPVMNGNGVVVNHHVRVSSLDSTTSEDSCAQTPHYGSITNLQREQQFGSITSLASSTSLISQQELAQLIDEANQTLEEGGCGQEVVVVILHRDTAGGSVGITLAGGSDYEVKEITVHKVLAGSPADRDGRIQKGDRILSINGRSMKGVSHRESLTILKAPRPEVVLVVSRWRIEAPEESNTTSQRALVAPRTPRILEQQQEAPIQIQKDSVAVVSEVVSRGPLVSVTLSKDGAGLGFSLEGGKDSPLGDQPLTIKKIFTGGCAEKSGQVFAGDELLSVNSTDVTLLSRIEAWGLMKRLPDGKVILMLKHLAEKATC